MVRAKQKNVEIDGRLREMEEQLRREFASQPNWVPSPEMPAEVQEAVPGD